jgi:hypothetical protein
MQVTIKLHEEFVPLHFASKPTGDDVGEQINDPANDLVNKTQKGTYNALIKTTMQHMNSLH